MIRRSVDGVYYLLLGVWCGGLVMLAVGAGITFRTVRSYDPVLGAEPYNDPALADQAANILAGGVVGNVLGGLAVVEIICAVGLLACVVLQWSVWGLRWRVMNLVRLGLLVVAAGLLAAHLWVIAPAIDTHRSRMYDPALTAGQRAEARAAFEPYHEASEKTAGGMLLLLAGACVISPFVLGSEPTPRGGETESPDG